MAPENVLDVASLSVGYQMGGETLPVVDQVSFSIAPGSIVALVGESGSGKSTVAQAVLRLLPANGRILGGAMSIAGVDTMTATERRMRSLRGPVVSLVPQDPVSSLNPVRTIGSQLTEVFALHGLGKGRKLEGKLLSLMETVGLPDPPRHLRQYPHQLSGGMLQRVLIAAAVALEPALIVADEATSALDVTVQATILDLLERLRRETNTSILLITHDLAVAADRASSVVVMYKGKVVESGDVREIWSNPSHPYTRSLLENAPSVQVAQARVDKRSPVAADSTAKPLLEVTNLHKVFSLRKGREVHAVDGTSFRVYPGSTHALVGESGSGKTTVARIAAMLEVPTSGAVLFDGQDVSQWSPSVKRQRRRDIQVVYQSPYSSLNPRMSVENIISDPLRSFGVGDRAERRSRVTELLEVVALPAAYRNRKPQELSGGQRQRVAIARALALKPRLVVLDEAVSALDVSIQGTILALLADLQRELSLSYLFISHDLAVVRLVADTVSVMRRGRVEEEGRAIDVFERPRADYTRQLLQAIPGQRV